MAHIPDDVCACKRNDPNWLAEAERLANRWKGTREAWSALMAAGEARGVEYDGWPLPLDYDEYTDALYGPGGLSTEIAFHRYGAPSTRAGQPDPDSDCTCRVLDRAWYAEYQRLCANFHRWKEALRAVVAAEEAQGISQDARPFSDAYIHVAHAVYGERGAYRAVLEHVYGPMPSDLDTRVCPLCTDKVAA